MHTARFYPSLSFRVIDGSTHDTSTRLAHESAGKGQGRLVFIYSINLNQRCEVANRSIDSIFLGFIFSANGPATYEMGTDTYERNIIIDRE
jgi:hypothetical protein